jgi:release factor glutamine methyltransferase
MKKWMREKEWLIRDKYAGERAADLTDDLRRLKAGEPIDYIIGWKEFLGVKIDLSLRPLIPRPETEYWVAKVVKGDPRPKILDIFAGSGCAGLAVLKHWPEVKVDFADLDDRALEQVRINLKLNKLRGRLIKSDVFKNIKGKYDLILANPPYIPAGRKLSQSVASFEPRRALFAGADGLNIIKKFLKDLPQHLRPGGTCYLEFDTNQKILIDKLLEKLGYQNHTFYRDQYGRYRYLVLTVEC